jgi:hypothetical protein
MVSEPAALAVAAVTAVTAPQTMNCGAAVCAAAGVNRAS